MSDNLLLDIKHDLFARLMQDDWLSTVHIVQEDEHEVSDRVDLILKGKVKRGGKTGAYIAESAFEVGAANDGANTPTPPMSGKVVFEVGENVIVNSGDRGTKKNAAQIVSRLVVLIGGLNLVGLATGFRLAPNSGIVQVQTIQGERVFEVTFIADYAFFSNAVISPSVTITEASGTITITAAGADSILYSDDGSYPATTYTAPFVSTAGKKIRAVSHTADQLASSYIPEHAVTG